MNEDQNQFQNDIQEPYVSDLETPYVSRLVISEEDLQDLHARVATRSFIIVFAGLIVTTIAAYLALSSESFLISLLSGGFGVLLIAELVVVLINSWAIRKKNLVLAGILYLTYAIINGITMSIVFLAYDLGSVKEAFLVAGIVFGVMAAYGYFTKKDLTNVGSICLMALVGVILVSLINGFLIKSAGLDLLMDYVVVLLFVGITAFDMYKMKQMVAAGGEEEINRVALFTGMQLYLDFINLFLRLLRIMGRRR